MAKRYGVISAKRKMKHPHKTKKRQAAKRSMLASRAAKKKW
jgi:hypothetical protein